MLNSERWRTNVSVFVFVLLLLFVTEFIYDVVFTTTTMAVRRNYSGQQANGTKPSNQTMMTATRTMTTTNEKATQLASTDYFSACLLTMDDNHFLIEWLAYHYHTLPLRRLIVAVDPNSKTSPSHIFDRWRKHNFMTIEEWTDSDFFPGDYKQRIQSRKNRLSTGTTIHLERQKLFYKSCLEKLKHSNMTWTLVLDVDEYLSLNTFTETVHVDMERPASMLNFLKAEMAKDVSSLPTTSPCIMIPRLQFGSVESREEQVSSQVPMDLNGSTFQTLRFRKYGPPSEFFGLVKTIIDLSRVDPVHIQIGSAHRPLFQYCPKQLRYLKVPQSPLVVRHYLGTWEEFFFRDDVRHADGQKDNKVGGLFVVVCFTG